MVRHFHRLPAESLLPACGLGPLFLCWGGVLGKLVCVTIRRGEIVCSRAADPYSLWFSLFLSYPHPRKHFKLDACGFQSQLLDQWEL